MTCEVEKTVVNNTKEVLDLPPGVPPLRSLYLYISGSCNLACKHCWITPTYQPVGNLPEGNDGKFVKIEHVAKAIREAKPLGLQSVKLTGGEPTIHPQFRELVTLISNEGLDINIETNGVIIDDDLAGFLKEAGRVCFISVSLDGATPETHDVLRSVPGSHAKAIAGIRALVRAGFRPQMICTLHRGNTSEMAEVVKLAENLGCGSVKFNHVQRVGRGEHFAEEQGLEIKELVDLYQYLERELTPNSKLLIHFDIPFAFFPIRKLLGNSLNCCSVHNILGMLAGGELSICGIGRAIPDLILGNIEEVEFKQLWWKDPVLLLMRELIPGKLEGICGNCLHRRQCLGVCVANNYQRTGKLNSAYYFCAQAEIEGYFPVSRKKNLVNISV